MSELARMKKKEDLCCIDSGVNYAIKIIKIAGLKKIVLGKGVKKSF
jgi:hypothetical protein